MGLTRSWLRVPWRKSGHANRDLQTGVPFLCDHDGVSGDADAHPVHCVKHYNECVTLKHGDRYKLIKQSTYAGTKVPGLAGYPTNFYLGRSVVFRVVSHPPLDGDRLPRRRKTSHSW